VGYNPSNVIRRLLTLVICLAALTGGAFLLPQAREPQVAEQQKEVTVYVTRTGKKYHRASCSHLRQSSIPLSLADARS
jgi:hypothetical protein